MANKQFKKNFAEGFQGINGEQSNLTLDTGFVNRALNYEMAVGDSMRGRVGCQYSGSGFFGLFPYTYTRTQDEYSLTYTSSALTTTKTAADGSTINNLIGISDQIWTLDTMTIPVTRVSGSYPFTWYATVSGTAIHFIIAANSVTILDVNLLDGISSATSIIALLASIDATTQLSCAYTTRGIGFPYAIVSGPQTTTSGGSVGYGTKYTLTTTGAGHNFSPGDILTVWNNNGFSGPIGVFVIAVTSTTITYVGPQLTFLGGETLGYMGQPATMFPIAPQVSAIAGTLNIQFPYWRLIPEGDLTFRGGGTGSNYGKILASSYDQWGLASEVPGSFFAPPVAESCQGCLYIGSSGYSPDGTTGYPNNIIKADGLTAVRAGLPTEPQLQNTLPGGAGNLVGVYKYKAFFRRVDAQGNITEGVPSPIKTVTAASEPVGIKVSMLGYLYTDATGFQGRSCYKYTAESPSAGVAFQVDDNTGAPGLNAFIQPGDPICLLDNVAPITGLNIGTLHRTVCTEYDGGFTPSRIKVADSSGYTIPDNSPISTGLTAVVLRTTGGGNQYYYLFEIPVTGYADAATVQDNVGDTTLVTQAQYIEVEIGKEHNPPPPCSLVCQHQGGLVVARATSAPNSVSFSSADGVEYFPTASNTFDIPSTISGPITAIASDTTDRLAVFKDRGYYDAQGDLDGGSFTVNVKNEGDYGVVSQASLVRTNNTLLGLSKNGWVVVQDGVLDPYKFGGLSARVVNQLYNFGYATAVNDYFNRQYICSIPNMYGEPVTYVIDYSRNKILTLERSYPTQIDPVGGMAMYGDTLYHLSGTSPYGVYRRIVRFDRTKGSNGSPTGNDADCFIDNTSAINYVLESQPINLDEPGQLKTPVRVRVWSLPNDYVVEGWQPFSVLVETGASPLASNVGGTAPNASSSTLTFATTNDIFKDTHLKNCKTHFYIVRLTTNTIRTAPFISGYEVMFAENYEKEDFVK